MAAQVPERNETAPILSEDLMDSEVCEMLGRVTLDLFLSQIRVSVANQMGRLISGEAERRAELTRERMDIESELRRRARAQVYREVDGARS